jgi:hypothetical protein
MFLCWVYWKFLLRVIFGFCFNKRGCLKSLCAQLQKNQSASSEAGLPDGILSDQKIPVWVNFGGSCNEDVGILNGHLVDLTPFDIFYGHLVYCVLSWFWYNVPIKIWQPWSQ